MSNQSIDYQDVQRLHAAALESIHRRAAAGKTPSVPDGSWDWTVQVAVSSGNGPAKRGRQLLSSGRARLSINCQKGRKGYSEVLDNKALLSLEDADLPMSALGLTPQPTWDLLYLWRPGDRDQPGWKPHAILSCRVSESTHYLEVIDDRGSKHVVRLGADGSASETVKPTPKNAIAAPLPVHIPGWPKLSGVEMVPVDELLSALHRSPGFQVLHAEEQSTPTQPTNLHLPSKSARIWGWGQDIPDRDADLLDSVDTRPATTNLFDLIKAIQSGCHERALAARMDYANGVTAKRAVTAHAAPNSSPEPSAISRSRQRP